MSNRNLDDYLKGHSNSVFREKLTNYRFFYEVKLAAARNESDIRIFIPEIDKDGYDVVLDDGDKIKPFQLKAKNKSSTTSEWEVSKSLLRPHPSNSSCLGFEESPEGEGNEGGFILVELTVNKDTIEAFEYYYTDTYILKAFEIGFLKPINSTYQQNIETLMRELHSGSRREKIKLRKCNLVKVKSVDHLLALADIPSIYHNQWQSSFRSFYMNYTHGKIINNEREDLVDILTPLIDDKKTSIILV